MFQITAKFSRLCPELAPNGWQLRSNQNTGADNGLYIDIPKCSRTVLSAVRRAMGPRIKEKQRS